LHSENQQVQTDSAPTPLGAYSHAMRVQDWLFLSGQGARDPKTGKLVSPTRNGQGGYSGYDIREHTRACLENVKAVVESAGGKMSDIVDVTVLLVNMQDFAGFNEIYETYFRDSRPARTTMGVSSLPMENIIEIKAVAYLGARAK